MQHFLCNLDVTQRGTILPLFTGLPCLAWRSGRLPLVEEVIPDSQLASNVDLGSL